MKTASTMTAARHHVLVTRPLKVVTMLSALLAFSAASARPAHACSCLQPTIESSYNNASDVVAARILLAFDVGGGERWHIAQVTKPYKGCLDERELVVLSSADDSAACGVALQPGVSYLVNGRDDGSTFGLPRLSVGLCDYNLPLRELGQSDRDFLNGRSVCCGDSCACADGSQPVNCFADPCTVTPACSEATQCVANYCGGCNAELYDASGYAVCEASTPAPECQSDADCAPTGCSGQICSSEPRITTCEWRDEYACYQAPTTSCGCNAGSCGWAETAELAQCLEQTP